MHKKLLGVTVTGVALLSLAMTAQAKTIHYAKLNHINLHDNTTSKYVTGTATKGSTVKISRYKVIFALGKTDNTGHFRLRLQHQINRRHRYRITVSKKGYQTTVGRTMVKNYID